MLKRIMIAMLAISICAGTSSAFASVLSSDQEIFSVPGSSNDARGLSQINDAPSSPGVPITGVGTTALTHSGTFTLKVTVNTSVNGTPLPAVSDSSTGTVALASQYMGPKDGSVVYAISSSHQVYSGGTLKASASTSCTW